MTNPEDNSNNAQNPIQPAVLPADETANEKAGIGIFSVMKSVLAAGLGVQSRQNRERDFQHGRPIHFIVGGLVGTILFVLVIVLVVRILLSSV